MPKSLYYFRPCPADQILRQLTDRYQVMPIDRDGLEPSDWELPAVVIADATRDRLEQIRKVAPHQDDWRVIYLLDGLAEKEIPPPSTSSDRVFALLPEDASRAVIEKAIERAFESLESLKARRQDRQALRRAASDLKAVNGIGVALSAERNTDALLELILAKSREITGADAGSLYLVDEDAAGGTDRLVFKLTQSASHKVPFREFTLPIDRGSAAGYAAATGEILNIPDAYRLRNRPFRLNPAFDRQFGYRTKSMLVVPMKNQKGDVTGVLQLINAKKDAHALLVSDAVVAEEVRPFSKRSQDLAASLASQAAVTLENNLLYRDIQRLFEGFVRASITAIESRDPSTSGHSERVAKLTVGLAEHVDRSLTGAYREVRFSHQDIQELRYAALLHDFGKVGVRERVLVKAKKLYPLQLELIKERFYSTRKTVELEGARRKIELLLAKGSQNIESALARIDATGREELERLDQFLEFILRVNEPSRELPEAAAKLAEIAGSAIAGRSSGSGALLEAEEVRLLSIPRGTLDAGERSEIESHVVHSFQFLSRIPWTRELKRIPEIARAHHEKLDGSGYPDHIQGDAIPFQAKMMTIADIFDALTASDRPYKRAVAVERALDILGQEAKSRLLDPALLQLFVDAKVYQLTASIR